MWTTMAWRSGSHYHYLRGAGGSFFPGILYDSEVSNNNNIEALSLVTEGERLAPGTNWAGSPVNAV